MENNQVKKIIISALILLTVIIVGNYLIIPLLSGIGSGIASVLSVIWEGVLFVLKFGAVVIGIIAILWLLNTIYYFIRISNWQDISSDYNDKSYCIEPERVIEEKNKIVQTFKQLIDNRNLPEKLQINSYKSLLLSGKNVSGYDSFIPKNPLLDSLKLFKFSIIMNDIIHVRNAKENIELFTFIDKENQEIETQLEAQIKRYVPIYKLVFCSTRQISPPPVLLHTFENARKNIADSLLLTPLKCTFNFQIQVLEQLKNKSDINSIKKQYLDYKRVLQSEAKELEYLITRVNEFYLSLKCFESNSISASDIDKYQSLAQEVPDEIANYISSVFGKYD